MLKSRSFPSYSLRRPAAAARRRPNAPCTFGALIARATSAFTPCRPSMFVAVLLA